MSDNNSLNAVFTAVSVRSERERVFSRLIEERRNFSFQIKKTMYQGRFHSRDKGALIFGTLDNFEAPVPIEVIASFSLPPEMFFIKTIVTARGDRFAMDLDSTLFKLQRRDNFRLMIPSRYKAKFELRSVDLEEVKQSFSVVDVSGGGLSFEMLYANDRLRAGCHVTGLLSIGDAFTRPVVGRVKHLRPFGSMGSGVFRVGLQFEGLSNAEHEEIIGLVMKIHRDSFSKFKML